MYCPVVAEIASSTAVPISMHLPHKYYVAAGHEVAIRVVTDMVPTPITAVYIEPLILSSQELENKVDKNIWRRIVAARSF